MTETREVYGLRPDATRVSRVYSMEPFQWAWGFFLEWDRVTGLTWRRHRE